MNFFKENFNESGEQPNAVNQRKFTMRWKSYEMHIYTVKRISVRVWVWNDIAHAIENAHMENCDIFQRITAVICWWSVCTFHNIPLRLNSFRFYSCPCVCMCMCICARACCIFCKWCWFCLLYEMRDHLVLVLHHISLGIRVRGDREIQRDMRVKE